MDADMPNHNNTLTKLICFYLPQFHPIPENDAWWGPGFTEWTNVTTSKPRFPGHHQPQIPADLGFYDLRLPETRAQQAKLAKYHGVHGFCYYHYWFNGKMLLERPFNEVLASGEPDFPLCLCWANENWTRAWDGCERQILMPQEYSEADTLAHIQWLITAFRDKRYIRIGNKPLLLIYRAESIPDMPSVVAAWRKIAKKNGFEGLYLCAIKNSFTTVSEEEIIRYGFDAIVDFQPNSKDFPQPSDVKTKLYGLAAKLLPDVLYQRLKHTATANKIFAYADMVDTIIAKAWPTLYKKFPCVFPSWDNSARRKTSIIIQNDDPDAYEMWLSHAIKTVAKYPDAEKLVFINAWNEWAEGCHLEPDQRNGRKFLEATKRAVQSEMPG